MNEKIYESESGSSTCYCNQEMFPLLPPQLQSSDSFVSICVQTWWRPVDLPIPALDQVWMHKGHPRTPNIFCLSGTHSLSL
ncbi:unnamed protein product [Allacma fusca]|uniref:Uncharacterized protein n=1 Tax=Allacma fusca TaxID=39272 RepID=A0A8J2P489_9HEXA|nr:unnamed protein product [Allacma fusca]